MVLLLRKPRPAAVSFRHAPAAGKGFGGETRAVRGNRVSIGIMQPSLQTLYSYWNELRAGRIAPQRLEIEPSRIAGILSETFMLERTDAGTYQFRLAGTRLCELFGSELRGKNFLDGWSDAGPPRARAALGDHQRAGRGGPSHHRGRRRHPAPCRVRRQPAAALHAGKITRIIGAMSATIAPHWLGSEPLRGRHLKHHRLIWPDGRPHAMLARLGRQAPFQPALADAGVRLVKSRAAAISRPRRRSRRRKYDKR